MARSEKQNRRMRDERREQIMSAALRVFAARGLGATRITHIAAEAGISQGLLYHYFRTKEEMYVELIRTAHERISEAARGLEKLPLTPLEKIEKAIRELLRLMSTNEDFAQYFMLTAQASVSTATPAEAAAIIRKRRGTPYEVIARILRTGQREGSIRDHDVDEMAVVFWTMIRGLAIHRAAFGKRFRAPDPGLLLQVFLPETRR